MGQPPAVFLRKLFLPLQILEENLHIAPIVIPAMYVLYYNRISSQFQERRGWHNERYGFYRMGPGNWR